MLPVSFGAMLLESFLAIIALVCVGFAATSSGLPDGTPAQVFASSISTFLTKVGLPESISYTLITLAVSAFALTSLDSVARVGRLAFQEFFIDDDTDTANMSPVLKFVSNKWVATIATLVLAFLLAKVGYLSIWPLFGSANQMLSALALLACAVYFKKTKRQGIMLWGPMFIMLAVTFTAIILKIHDLVIGLQTEVVSGNVIQLIFAVLLLILGIMVAAEGLRTLFSKGDNDAESETITAETETV
jgi:carbon starvation protein